MGNTTVWINLLLVAKLISLCFHTLFMFIIAVQPSVFWCFISRLHSLLWSICNSRKVNSCTFNLFTINWYFDIYIPRNGHKLDLSDVQEDGKFLTSFFNSFDQVFYTFIDRLSKRGKKNSPMPHFLLYLDSRNIWSLIWQLPCFP